MRTDCAVISLFFFALTVFAISESYTSNMQTIPVVTSVGDTIEVFAPVNTAYQIGDSVHVTINSRGSYISERNISKIYADGYVEEITLSAHVLEY